MANVRDIKVTLGIQWSQESIDGLRQLGEGITALADSMERSNAAKDGESGEREERQ